MYMSDFNSTLQRMLDNVPDTQDKRQSSPIYNALAPTAAELTQMDIDIQIFEEQTYLLTAVGINLDNWAANFSIKRQTATHAIRIAEMMDTNGQQMNLPVGSRFATPNVEGGVNFTLIKNLGAGRSLLECEAVGILGNAYLGPLLPLFSINNLSTATMVGTQIPAEDEENDASLLYRVLFLLNRKPFGGNVDAYEEFTMNIDGVGAVKIFPEWDGGGTVKLSIIDGELRPATSEFIAIVQDLIDPIPNNGPGYGIAPIGHRVTVTTPNTININITANVSLRSGYSISQLQASIEAAIDAYISSLRQEWADAPILLIYIARINAAIISVDGVNNVTGITINGNTIDLELIQTAQLQQLPMLGNVVLN